MRKTKGAALIDLVRLLRTDKERARRLLRPDLHHYLENQLLVALWYPAADLIEMIRACERMMPPGPDPLEVMGRFGGQQHLKGVYSHLRADSDPRTLSIKGFAIWSSLHDHGRLTVRFDEGKPEAIIDLCDFQFGGRESCGVLRGYAAAVFEFAGLKEVAVTETRCTARSDPTCQWIARWKGTPVPKGSISAR